jgi:hypothetical protein
MPNAGLEVLLPLGIGSLGGYWIGTIAGAWAALRLRSYGDRLGTAVAVGMLAPLPIAASIAMHSVVPADRTPVPSMTAGLLALAGIGAVARAVALWLSSRGQRSRRPPTQRTLSSQPHGLR